MVIRASTEGPVIFALAIFDRQVVDAGDPPAHQALFVELPILVAIAAKPVAGIVVPFIGKAHGYTVVAKCPDLLDQPVLQLANPLACEECLDGRAAANELGAVAPDAIHRIGKRYFGRIARVPGIFGEARLFRSSFCREGRKWRPIHFQLPYLRAEKDRDRSSPEHVGSRFCNRKNMRRSSLSLDGRKRGWRQQLAADVLDELAILLRLGDHRDPFGIGEKSAPALLALGHAVPGEHVGDLLVALADQRGPKPGLADAVFLPDP